MLTDEYIKTILDSGTKVFYRLGQSIEHSKIKYGVLPPKDFHKWARICEHIILHFNEGWADGYYYGIEYWEIWNEPDLNQEDFTKSPTWQGTKEQFFDLYEIAAKHLKSKFPHLKIGGPALAWSRDWTADFLSEMQRRNVPIDFFSWHRYDRNPRRVGEICDIFREMLDKNGYAKTESILNEWNYVRNWDTEYVYSLQAIAGINSAQINLIYDYVDENMRTGALALSHTISGICGFLVTLAISPLVTHIQNKGNTVLGIPMYAQQLLSVFGMVMMVVVILYIDLVLKRMQKNM